jgi:replicative DNA helicase
MVKPLLKIQRDYLFDLAEKGSFNSSLVKFDEAMKQTIEMASAAYKNEEGIVGVPTGLRDLDDKLGWPSPVRFNYYCWATFNG